MRQNGVIGTPLPDCERGALPYYGRLGAPECQLLWAIPAIEDAVWPGASDGPRDRLEASGISPALAT